MKPGQPLEQCGNCGATGTAGKRQPVDNRCRCEKPDWKPLELVPESVSVFDPVQQVPNEYARRVKERMLADVFYLRLQAESGHAVAAAATCQGFGHDARAGVCNRCGLRVGRRAA